MDLFIGRIDAKLDAKGRVVVPANFRKNLPENGKLIGHMDDGKRYLKVFTYEAWEEKINSLDNRLDEWDDDADITKMRYNAAAVELMVDAQGRLLIPKNQKEKMQVKTDLTFVSMGKTFAIWDKDLFDECFRQLGPLKVPAKS